MTEDSIHTQIQNLIDREHELRQQLGAGEITADDENAQLTGIETQLDQLWDLLRQRRARREFGADPNDARERPAATVEGYED